MSDTFKKDLLAKEDINFDSNRNNETFNKDDSTGSPQVRNKVNAKHLPVTNALTWDSAESVEDFLAKTIELRDTVNNFLNLAGNWDAFLGTFTTPALLAATFPTPNTVDDFAFVDSTKSFHFWDQDIGTPAWVDILSQAYARANHTGSQAISTITGLQAALDADIDAAELDFVPSNSTPDDSGTAATATTQLAAILNGMDKNERKNNFVSGVPGLTDDSDSGYSIGSQWTDTATGFIYVASDVTVGAAVWGLLAAGAGEILIASANISTPVANVEITIPTGFRKLRVEWEVKLVDNASAYSDFFMELKLNATFKTSNYLSSLLQYGDTATFNHTSSTKIFIARTNFNTPDEHFGEMSMFNESGKNKVGYGQFTGGALTAAVKGGVTSWSYESTDSTAVIDSIRLSGTTNLESGKIRVYGVND